MLIKKRRTVRAVERATIAMQKATVLLEEMKVELELRANNKKMAKYKVLEDFVMNGKEYLEGSIVELDYAQAHLKSIQPMIEEVTNFPSSSEEKAPEPAQEKAKVTVDDLSDFKEPEGQLPGNQPGDPTTSSTEETVPTVVDDVKAAEEELGVPTEIPEGDAPVTFEKFTPGKQEPKKKGTAAPTSGD